MVINSFKYKPYTKCVLQIVIHFSLCSCRVCARDRRELAADTEAYELRRTSLIDGSRARRVTQGVVAHVGAFIVSNELFTGTKDINTRL